MIDFQCVPFAEIPHSSQRNLARLSTSYFNVPGMYPIAGPALLDSSVRLAPGRARLLTKPSGTGPPYEIKSTEDIERAFDRLNKSRAEALLIPCGARGD